jgi:hypothetical protein
VSEQASLSEIAQAFQRFEVLDLFRRGRLPTVWREIVDGDPLFQRVVMVIEISLGGMSGRTVRVSTVPVRSSSSRRGTRHDAVVGLVAEPSLSADFTFGSATSPARSVDFTLDASLIRPMEAIRAGMFLSGVAEVSLEVAGIENDYDERYVLLRGDVEGVAFGAPPGSRGREIVTMQVVDPRESCSAKLPPWVLDETRHSALHDSAIGQTYPIVLNSARRIPAPRLTSTGTGSNSFAAAAGVVDVAAATGQVFINGSSAFGGINAWVAEQDTDDEGTLFTKIRFTDAARVWADSDAVHVTSTERDTDLQLNPVEAVREIVRRYSPIGVQGMNHELFATASARWPGGLSAPRVVINAAGGNAASALDWIESGFLGSYPMLSMIWSNGGYGPVLTDSRARALASLVEGQYPLIQRSSLVSEASKRDLVNEITLRYDYDPMQDTWGGVVTRSPSNSGICAASRGLVGQRVGQPIDSVYIVDLLTANYVVDWIVQHRALPSYLVEYEVAPPFFLLYQIGDTVELTSDELDWDNERATIEKMSYQRGKVTVTFRVWLRYLDVGAGALARPA